MTAAAIAFARHAFQRAQRQGRPTASEDAGRSLDAALEWLGLAQDIADGGVSYGYCLLGGWRAPYRETSGYLVPTLYRAARALSRPDLADRATRIAEWLLTVQNADGSFSNPRYGTDGIVFDTGQVLFGLVCASLQTKQTRLLGAAQRAGEWLVRATDGDGIWRASEFRGVEHAYNTRTAWAMLELDRIKPDPTLVQVARANLDFALTRQQPNGLFTHNAFRPGTDPYTHNWSYAICGLQEAGWLLGESAYVAAARRCSDTLRALMRDDGFIAGRIKVSGETSASYSCLTGQAQLTIAWFRQAMHENNESARSSLIAAGSRSLAYVRQCQQLDGSPNTLGAIAGSQPIWGGYAPFSFPNWATKFFVDASLLAERAQRDELRPNPHRA